MKSHQDTKIKKTVLVISDLHLSAGAFVDGRKNYLEDFQFDKELIEFLTYYSTCEYETRPVELVINGDFFDLLAVPFVKYFDDEFWSEKAALEKLKIATSAHKEVLEALNLFAKGEGKKITYIIGNHDAEFLFESLQNYLSSFFEKNFFIILDNSLAYEPIRGVSVMHGHEYEFANLFDKNSLIKDNFGNNYFIPPWGSYYVTRVVNKFKVEKRYINSVKPIKYFLIHGFLFEPLFTLRFLFSSFFYFFMVRFLYLFKKTKNLKSIWVYLKKELAVFRDYEAVTQDYFREHPHLKALIVGHSHMPCFTEYPEGSIFINTGTWTRTYRLGFSERSEGVMLTYALIDEFSSSSQERNFDLVLNIWRGKNNFPFVEF